MNIKEDVREETMGVGIKEGEVKELSTEEEWRDIIKRFWKFWKRTCESINQSVKSAIGQGRA